MTRLILIFIITFLMVMDAPAQERHFRPGGGEGGWHGQRHYPGPYRPGYRYDRPEPLGDLLGGIIGGFLWNQFNQPTPPPPEDLK